jgi:hypothetical protein
MDWQLSKSLWNRYKFSFECRFLLNLAYAVAISLTFENVWQLLHGVPLDRTKGTPDFIAEAFPRTTPDLSIREFLTVAKEALDAAGLCQVQFGKSNSKLKTFLNRVLGVKLDLQNLV